MPHSESAIDALAERRRQIAVEENARIQNVAYAAPGTFGAEPGAEPADQMEDAIVRASKEAIGNTAAETRIAQTRELMERTLRENPDEIETRRELIQALEDQIDLFERGIGKAKAWLAFDELSGADEPDEDTADAEEPDEGASPAAPTTPDDETSTEPDHV